ncbi:MAG: hypothetical protein ABI828_06965 [Actinomycetota bacterium]
MANQDLSIVIGEGASGRSSLLRLVLEGEGFEVAADAETAEELSRAIAAQQPDIVVLDDALGVAGLELARAMAPNAKFILVWPAAVQTNGDDARVDPATVVRELGPAIVRVAAVSAPSRVSETFAVPEWTSKVRKDPAKLREILGDGRTLPSRPSVTEIQRRNRADADEEDAARPIVVPDIGGAERARAVAGGTVFSSAVGQGTTSVRVAGEAPGGGRGGGHGNGAGNANGHTNMPIHHHKA